MCQSRDTPVSGGRTRRSHRQLTDMGYIRATSSHLVSIEGWRQRRHSCLETRLQAAWAKPESQPYLRLVLPGPVEQENDDRGGVPDNSRATQPGHLYALASDHREAQDCAVRVDSPSPVSARKRRVPGDLALLGQPYLSDALKQVSEVRAWDRAHASICNREGCDYP
jgi:hypothetical protein